MISYIFKADLALFMFPINFKKHMLQIVQNIKSINKKLFFFKCDKGKITNYIQILWLRKIIVDKTELKRIF